MIGQAYFETTVAKGIHVVSDTDQLNRASVAANSAVFSLNGNVYVIYKGL